MNTSNPWKDKLPVLRVFEQTEVNLDHVNFNYKLYRDRLFDNFGIEHNTQTYQVFARLVIPIISAALEGGYDIEGIQRLIGE